MLDLAKIADLVLTSMGKRDSSYDAQGTSQFVCQFGTYGLHFLGPASSRRFLWFRAGDFRVHQHFASAVDSEEILCLQ